MRAVLRGPMLNILVEVEANFRCQSAQVAISHRRFVLSLSARQLF
jgi:hypothetical protein